MRVFIFIITSILYFETIAQTFWSEPFNNGCTNACTAVGFNSGLGAWTQSVTGAEGANPNAWFVSCAENGNATGACGSGCGANATLHLSAQIGNPFCPNDCGAAYDAGGLCGLLTCPRTNRRIQSPAINCTGYSGISLNFTYIENGQTTLDDATVWYFDGTAWSQIDNPPKTATGCGGQGIWTARTVALPASANNNANVRIGFRWVNNDDGAGTDPSIAINDITLSVPVLPIELSDFTIKKAGQTVLLKWSTMMETNFDGFAIQRSDNGIGFNQVGFIKGQKNSNGKKNYTFNDKGLENGTYYYRLKAIDLDGSYSYSDLKTIYFSNEIEVAPYYNSLSSSIVFPSNSIQVENGFSFEILSIDGRRISQATESELTLTNGRYHFPVQNIPFGLYILRILDNSSSSSYRLIISE